MKRRTRPTTPTIARVLCVDDSPDMLTTMRMVVETDPTMEYVGGFASADSLLAEAHRLAPRPGAVPLVVLLDARMQGKNPLEAVRELAAALPWVRVVILSGYDDPAFHDQAMDAGAWGWISKSYETATILHAVRSVAERPVRATDYSRRD